jgi:tetratricopeptide (TPR) repeat protein
MSGSGSEIWSQDLEARDWLEKEDEIWSKKYKSGYLFRNLGREDVYYFPTTNIRLLQNLRSAYIQLAAFHYMAYKDNENGDKDKADLHREKALEVMAKMQDNIPEKTIRFDSKDLHYQVGRLFGELGNKDELRRIIDNLMMRDDLTIRDRVDFGQVYISQLDSFEIGRAIFEVLYADFNQIENGDLRVTQKEMEEWRKNFTQIVSSLVYTYKQLDQHSEAEAILADWLDKNPNDPVAQKLLEDLKTEMGKG